MARRLGRHFGRNAAENLSLAPNRANPMTHKRKRLLPRCAELPLERLRDFRCWGLLTSKGLQFANIISGPLAPLERREGNARPEPGVPSAANHFFLSVNG
jgi:hypothetical protein